MAIHAETLNLVNHLGAILTIVLRTRLCNFAAHVLEEVLRKAVRLSHGVSFSCELVRGELCSGCRNGPVKKRFFWGWGNDESHEILAPRLAWRGSSGAFLRHSECPLPRSRSSAPRLFSHMAKSIKSNPPRPVVCDLLFSSMACRPPFRAF